MSRSTRILIAGGGSGGHVFPGLAIADELRRGCSAEIVFAGTARGLEASVIPARGYALELLEVAPLKGVGLARGAWGALVAARAVVRSVALVRRVAPRVVLSVGGYAAGPVTLAAGFMGVPIAIVEPNGIAGLANRLLGPLAKRAYVAWGEAATSFAPHKVRAFGVPLRPGFRPMPYEPGTPFRVLVLGGSHGASALNERLPEALGTVSQRLPELAVIHQTGKGRAAAVEAAYEKAGVRAASVVEFLDDVAGELARADVVVARSGAGTVAEIAAVGRPALLIPFPFAADDHQAHNALALERAGGAVFLRQDQADACRLSDELRHLLEDPERRRRMSEASQAFGRPDAASEIARDMCDLAGVAWRHGSRRASGDETNGASPVEAA